MKAIVILVFVSPETGLGHWVRMKPLAEILQTFGVKVALAVNADTIIINEINELGIPFITLNAIDDQRFIRYIQEQDICLTIIDTKLMPEISFLRKIKEHTKLVLIDHLGEACTESDLTILPNCHNNINSFSGLILSGTKWSLIHPEVLSFSPKKEFPVKIKRIAVTSGGSDPAGVLLHILRLVTDDISYEWMLFPGDHFIHTKELQNIASSSCQIKIRPYNLHDIYSCDMVLSAFGVSAYEWVFFNMPLLLVSHNIENIDAAGNFSAIFPQSKSLGFYKNLSKETLMESISNVLKIQNAMKREELADTIGSGYRNVASYICSLI